MVRRCLLASIFLLLTPSCVLHRPYVSPYVETPESWRLPTDDASVQANIRWWEQFNDPVLDSLIDEALQNNNDLQVAIARVQEFWQRYKIVRSQLFPQVFATASDVREKASAALEPLPLGFPRTTTTYSLAINGTYELDIWGRITSQTEAALADYYSQIEVRRTVVLTLVSAVANAYIELRQFDQQLDVARKTQKAFEESLELARDRFVGGLTSEMPVAQQQAELDNAILQVKQLEILQQQQENLLCVLIGRNPSPLERGLTLDALVLPLSVPSGLPSQLLEQRPDIIGAEEQLVRANALFGAAMAEAFPQISLTGAFGNTSLELHKLLTGLAQTWLVSVSGQQSIYSGGRITADILASEAVYQEALYAYKQTILNAFQDVNDALIAFQKSKEIVKAQADQVEALKLYLELAILQYDNGQTDYLNVLDAERGLFSAQLNYVQAEANCFTAIISLYKALGGGWVLDADDQAVNCISFLNLDLDLDLNLS